jgi:hypothetical protein
MHFEAEQICADERVRAKFRSMNFGRKPLCDDSAILRVRLARADERAIYKAAANSNNSIMLMVYMVKIDSPS